ncbi:MAG: helix-hairpin-helix domain-containing protein [Paludibacter sp.]|jgi:competence ComEA-like helix-hairpin-helix protein|nr:helix-hairpin-helix domain-containing protein [Paludibacter sp.]
MWKEFFYFSKSQRIGLISLFALIVLAIAGNYFLPYFFKKELSVDNNFLAEVQDFKQHIAMLDSIADAERREQYLQNRPNYSNFYTKRENVEITLFQFDPNIADSATFVALGLPPFVAANIVKYRERSGSFKTKESFSRVYNLSADKFAELEPYIDIKIADSKIDTAKLPAENPHEKITLKVELNFADTAELLQVRGIGKSYAREIIRFRNLAGGFYSIEQLREIRGMTDDNFRKISEQCTVNAALINKISVNSASVDKLRAHPYINFYQAQAIYELRRQKIKLSSIDNLRHLKEFSPEQLAKLEPYLSFQ